MEKLAFDGNIIMIGLLPTLAKLLFNFEYSYLLAIPFYIIALGALLPNLKLFVENHVQGMLIFGCYMAIAGLNIAYIPNDYSYMAALAALIMFIYYMIMQTSAGKATYEAILSKEQKKIDEQTNFKVRDRFLRE